MQTGLYVALSSQVALERRINTLADNVANASTAGFRGTQVKFDEVLANTGASKTAFVSPGQEYLDTNTGGFKQTGNPLDVAIKGTPISRSRRRPATRSPATDASAWRRRQPDLDDGLSGPRCRRRPDPAQRQWRRNPHRRRWRDPPGRAAGSADRSLRGGFLARLHPVPNSGIIPTANRRPLSTAWRSAWRRATPKNPTSIRSRKCRISSTSSAPSTAFPA